MKSKKIIIGIILLMIIIVAYRYFSKSRELPYDWVLAEHKDIVQKVLATGQVIPAKKISLQFEVQGKIKDIKAESGDEVKTNDVLLVLDDRDLYAQVLEVQAARDVAKASLDKTIAGATPEEIKVYETAVENDKISLENSLISLRNAEQNLINAKASAQESLKSAYEDALTTLDDVYLKLYNAFEMARLIQLTYFTQNNQEGIRVLDSKNLIESSLNQAKTYLNSAKADSKDENIEKALSGMKNALENTSSALTVIRQTCEEFSYRSVVSSTDKTSLDTQRTNINTALTNIVNAQQTISSTKITNESNIHTAQASVDSARNTMRAAEGDLKSAQDKLAQIKASPQQVDIDLARAKLEQAQATLLRANQQLAKTKLLSPCDGVITDIKKKEGEQSLTTESAVLIICKGNFQIEVDIPETDIGKIKPQSQVNISLDAFPAELFAGKVIKIDPAETIIQSVVYYKVTVNFEGFDERIKPGMTADADIIIVSKENVLSVPQRAILARDGEKIVRVLEGKNIKEVIVETGIQGSEGEVEILSGLGGGEKVITFVKQK